MDKLIFSRVMAEFSVDYLGVEANDSDSRVVELFYNFFEDPGGGRPLLSDVDDIGSVHNVTFELEEFCAAVARLVGDFGLCLRDRPTKVLAHLGLALLVLRESHLRESQPPRKHTITVRFTGVHPQLPLSDLKASMVGKLVSLTGYVVRVSSIQPLVAHAAFECPKCGALARVHFEDGKFAPPERCANTQCRARVFELRRDSAVTVDSQRLKLQEVDNSLADAGRVPRTVEVEVNKSLVDSCSPGDLVTIVGVVKSVNADHAAGRGGKRAAANSLFILYVAANSVTNQRSASASSPSSASPTPGSEDRSSSSPGFTHEELHAIREIAMEPDAFGHVVSSICPSIFGHDHVKAGLALGLFGGAKSDTSSRDRLSVRSDPHILVVGDPGLGKSQMLRAACALAPRSVYVSANTTTATGLTVTVSKESGSGGDVVLEAGALVLADQGVCCVDEFDKIGCDSHCLLEAMEQQSVSIAKSGIVANLSARCSVLAAANPHGGHYDSSKTINENLKMSAALLSRFDLVFILLDKPEEAHDRKLSEYIMRSHAVGEPSSSRGFATASVGCDASQGPVLEATNRVVEATNRVVEQIKRGAHISPIPTELLRKYLLYARKYVHPKLTGAAAAVLQGLYLKFRDQARGGDSLPITTRQLESLVRLAQARAKMELRDTVTESDALDVVSLLEQSLMETFRTESGRFDFGRRGMSLAKQVKSFVGELNRQATNRNSALFQTSDLLEVAGRMSLGVSDFHSFLDTLNEQSYLLKKGNRLWQLQTHVSSSQGSARSSLSQSSRY